MRRSWAAVSMPKSLRFEGAGIPGAWDPSDANHVWAELVESGGGRNGVVRSGGGARGVVWY